MDDPLDGVPAAPDIDENGVDRGQIRAMLRLTPEERLRLVEEFVESALEPSRCCGRLSRS